MLFAYDGDHGNINWHKFIFARPFLHHRKQQSHETKEKEKERETLANNDRLIQIQTDDTIRVRSHHMR